MINVKNNSSIALHTYPINHEYKIKLNKLTDGEKISIFSNAMFMTMFQNEKRKAYSALLASYYLDDITFEELLDNLILSHYLTFHILLFLHYELQSLM